MKRDKRQPKQHIGRLLAGTAASVLAVVVAGAGVWQQMQIVPVAAKEAFQGIGQIVKEHEDEPFVIVDIVPGNASVEWTDVDSNSHTYELSMGTIGYLNAGQAPVEQDLKKIFTSEEEQALFYSYENRQSLAEAVVPTGYGTAENGFRIAYEEAYGGVTNIGKNSGWIKLYDAVNVEDSPASDVPTGYFRGYYEKVGEGKGDFAMLDADGNIMTTSTLSMKSTSVPGTIYEYDEEDGDYRVTFTEAGEAMEGYVPHVISTDLTAYSARTSVYRRVDGVYVYAGQVRDWIDTEDDGENDETPVDPDAPVKDEEEDGTPDGDETGEDSDDTTDGDEAGGDSDDTTDGDETGEDSDDTTDGDGAGEEGNDTTDSGKTGEKGNGTPNSDETGESDSTAESNLTGEGNDSTTTGGKSDAESSSTKVSSDGWQMYVAEEIGTEEKQLSDDGADKFYILRFEYVTGLEEAQMTYEVDGVYALSEEEGVIRPFDTYSAVGLSRNVMINGTAGADTAASADAVFYYMGTGKGDYLLKIADQDDTVSADGGQDDPDSTDDGQQNTGADPNGNASVWIEVRNVPVYFRCCSNDWLRKYVFSSLSHGDNESSDFNVEVRVVSADEVTGQNIYDADLVFLEGGIVDFMPEDNITKSYITQDGRGDMSEEAAYVLIKRAVEDLLPVIVDYDIVSDTTHYKDSGYQKTAKVFRKNDLSGFFYEFDGDLDDMYMNLGKDNKDDNSYHYVNKNIYFINGMLVGSDFNKAFDDDEADAGFGEVQAAIAAENTTIEDKDDKLSDEISKAKAVQYIINYAVGMIGDYKDLTILELQPGANTVSDFHRDVDSEKESVVLYWQRSDSAEAGQQILRSTGLIDTDISTKSVARFNGELEDINQTYDMVFIGLDGQSLNKDRSGKETVYNDHELDGKVYHSGDKTAGLDASYDYNDISQQKKEALLDYMRAGYPVVVENGFFTKSTAKDAKTSEINTDYVGKDTQMYDFIKTALEEYNDYLYTVADVRGNAAFRSQLNVVKPRIEYRTETDDSQASADGSAIQVMTLTETGEYQGTILYEISNDRGEQYYGDTVMHFYLDTNFDGVFSAAEEVDAYTNEYDGGYGQIDLLIDGVLSGIVPWKLEVTDAGNGYRRDAICGYFEYVGQIDVPVCVLQILNDKDNDYANLQAAYGEIRNSMLGYYLRGAESLANVSFSIETMSVDELTVKLAENADYLKQWDVLVLGFGGGDSLGDAKEAVNNYINEGRSVVISYAGASDDRLGLSPGLLGQSENRTYAKLGSESGLYYRYADLEQYMFVEQAGLDADQINEGVISYYPYRVGNAALGSATAVKAPEYLLDIDSNTQNDSETYVTAWYTLNKTDGGITAFNVSPKDARNNYYIYSKGNVVYVGQNEYPYNYDADNNKVPEGTGTDECRLFVNALMMAYNTGLHNSDINIVAGFQASSSVIDSIAIPYDQEIYDSGDEGGGILDETVDVYFKFTDNNLALQKEMTLRFYYEDPAGTPVNVGDKTVNVQEFASSIYTVEDNRLTEVAPSEMKQGQIYRIKAPVVALQKDNGVTNADIYVVLETAFRKAGRECQVISNASVSLNRAQLFLLE